MSAYAAKHAAALAKVKAAGQRIAFTRVDRPRNVDTGALGALVTRTVGAYALGLEGGDPATYAKLGLTFSVAPSLLVVCETYGDVPPNLAECQWSGSKHTVRDVKPFAPDGVPITCTVVVSR